MFSDAYDLFWQYEDTYMEGLRNALTAAALTFVVNNEYR